VEAERGKAVRPATAGDVSGLEGGIGENSVVNAGL
jgi:hypothetical protein